MAYSASSLGFFRWSAIPFAAAGLLATLGISLVPQAAQANDYAACAAALRDLDLTLDRATIADACALAYRPQEVSGCVTGVLSETTTITPVAALSACSRDRRPPEVATCVTDIHTTLPVADSPSVLDHCHRSLLPVRYSQCVIGLAETLDFTTDESLARCIAAGYRPENVAPTYIPLD
jgi:hypothetical protein